ncbi:sensor histidine kinase [Streptomyces sp. ISL-12]|uniref:sensor histidine kinase n=1 Tax=Streptomyces sp. ISL-12 TaxID=2819177 RepID=UPI001BE7A88A|nr:histidine kinase [Streptomyces sp. ISL-12]MBT2413586.1 sensor histidine kinase [Streptomyces sp. ISL-12]
MSARWHGRAAGHPRAVDALKIGGILVLTAGGAYLSYVVMDDPASLWPGVLLPLLACAALLRRRDHPVLVLAVTTLCTMAESFLGFLLTPLLMGPMLAAQYALSKRPNRRKTWYSACAATAGIVVTGLLVTDSPHEWIFGLVNPAAWVLMVASFGSYVRVRREYAVARAEHLVRERDEEARRRVIQERMRIARELHDVVAHHLALANAQAGTAAHLAGNRPEQAVEIIERLPETTAAALRELKATVELLRQDTDAGELAPAPGLDQLPDLVEACAAAGLDVTVVTEGRPRRLTPGLNLTAYRIVQESLTNVTKHAASRTARVRLAYTPHDLTLVITNEAAARVAAGAGTGGGFGLLGMRERALSAGGTFHAGPRAEGGFEVACSLPLPGPDESATP